MKIKNFLGNTCVVGLVVYFSAMALTQAVAIKIRRLKTVRQILGEPRT